ncbi:TonB-dependent receptor [Pseudoalteromonas sp. JBTF-M23]|uniref:TonB-dependent receptor n=1 Tax=Pseudoalteromonas caenipelagi TaxID=2726988 RepID=A0A849VD28_9GAMM|nr:TonB-dependent receptor [Pseudoalteromonas caenipelagi]NOU50463.1 TonB-dependent receptor [Pseudoalteromonas caenipelagi]
MMGNYKSHLLWCLSILSIPTGAYAESNEEVQAQSSIETITVTGSRIRRSVQAESSSPISSTELSDLTDIGANDVRDLIEVLPFNAGSQNNSDNLSQNFTVGTSNVNLRGLGVSSTLVLLNGIRQVTSAVVTDQGASFVDTASLVPALAIKRVEILKDGASAIYGSDAVAGVVNFITRDDLEGGELQYEYRSRWSEGSQDDTKIDFAYGGYVGDSAHMLLAISYLERSSLLLDEVDWLKPATSSFGNPGSFVIPSLADENNPSGLTVADPNCVANGGSLSQGANGNSFCLFDFGPQITAVPDEDRLQAYVRAKWDWSDTTRMWAEAGYARNKITREVSPSFPVLNAPSILASHPDNPYGEDIFFRGRPYGVGKPTETNYYDHTTTRVAFGADGEITEGIYWQASFVAAANDAIVNPRDVITDNFQAALHGFGGNKCRGAATSQAGVGECYYFNPFDPQDPDNERLRDYIIGDYMGDAESEMRVYEAVITGDSLFELDGGDVGFAIGIQYRDESINNVYDSFTQQDSFAFLIGNQNFTGERNVKALFAEVLLPVSENLELGAAVRYEDYGEFGGDTTNPKVSFLWLATEELSFRGTFSTSFRAPSVHQLQGVQTNFANITDPEDGSTTFGGNRTIGDPNLVPETSEALNLGVSYAYDDFNFDMDYWDFSFEDVLTRESHQAVVNANPNDPSRVVRTSAGTISIVNTKFINAEAIDTSGIDISASTIYRTDYGDYSPQLKATYLLSYDLMDASGKTTDGLGKLNLNTVGNPSPRLRGSIGLNWSNGMHRANVYVRHVASYTNDISGANIESFNTLDLQYGMNLGQVLKEDSESNLIVGVVNATDEAPPYVAVAGSYDPRTGDPRGRRAYIKFQFNF